MYLGLGFGTGLGIDNCYNILFRSRNVPHATDIPAQRLQPLGADGLHQPVVPQELDPVQVYGAGAGHPGPDQDHQQGDHNQAEQDSEPEPEPPEQLRSAHADKSVDMFEDTDNDNDQDDMDSTMSVHEEEMEEEVHQESLHGLIPFLRKKFEDITLDIKGIKTRS